MLQQKQGKINEKENLTYKLLLIDEQDGEVFMQTIDKSQNPENYLKFMINFTSNCKFYGEQVLKLQKTYPKKFGNLK